MSFFRGLWKSSSKHKSKLCYLVVCTLVLIIAVIGRSASVIITESGLLFVIKLTGIARGMEAIIIVRID